MARKSKMVDLLIERRLTDSDFLFRNQSMKDRLDKIGMLLNAVKAKWNSVNTAGANQIQEKDYDPKGFDLRG